MPNVIDLLNDRGFIEATTGEKLRDFAEKPRKVYCGFDPTSDSLHVGNMVAIMGLAWFQRCGHIPVAVIGGATGMIGDPSGKSHERTLLDEATIQKNLEGISKNLKTVLDFDHPTCKPIILNNYDWFKEFSFIDFLRDVGKYFRLGPMLARESVKNRLNSEEGMSFTEFSYQLLQGYDFLHLYDSHDVTLQVGGSDQWGNITAGSDLVKKVCGKSVHGLTFPLLVRHDGQKFGKTEKGAIWLSPEKLSPYEFYQSIFRVADADVINFMRLLTFMEMDEIRSYEQMLKQSDYVPNTVQKRLAEEVTRIVHGEEGVRKALEVTRSVMPGAKTELNAETLESIAGDMPSHHLDQDVVVGVKLMDLIVNIGLQNSKGEVRRLIRNKGVSINNFIIEDENHVIIKEDLVEGRLLLVAIGKKRKVLIRINEQKELV